MNKSNHPTKAILFLLWNCNFYFFLILFMTNLIKTLTNVKITLSFPINQILYFRFSFPICLLQSFYVKKINFQTLQIIYITYFERRINLQNKKKLFFCFYLHCCFYEYELYFCIKTYEGRSINNTLVSMTFEVVSQKN